MTHVLGWFIRVADLLGISTPGQKVMTGSLPVVVASDQSAVTVGGTVVANPTIYTVRLDEATATITYVGEAAPGTLTSAASWRIKRLDSTAGLVVLWADGNENFDNIWDNRAALSYS